MEICCVSVCANAYSFLLAPTLNQLLLYHDLCHSGCIFLEMCTLPSQCVGRFGYSKYLNRACINTHYLHHACVLKRFEITFQCVVALGFQPTVFSIYSTCRATGTCTGNLCIISTLLMLCLCRPLKSTMLWNKKPCFLSLPALLTTPSSIF